MAEYLQVQTPASPSGDIGCAPDNAGCSVGDAYLAYLEEEGEEEEEEGDTEKEDNQGTTAAKLGWTAAANQSSPAPSGDDGGQVGVEK